MWDLPGAADLDLVPNRGYEIVGEGLRICRSISAKSMSCLVIKIKSMSTSSSLGLENIITTVNICQILWDASILPLFKSL